MVTSSTSDGNILRVRRPSENFGRTPDRPFIKAIFSSRDLDAKVDRSKKLRVEIGKEEKNGYVGSAVGPGRD